MTRILVVVAHPDDEVLGCGGTIARLVKEGNEATSLILGMGRIESYLENTRSLTQANEIIGSHWIGPMDPIPTDNQFDQTALLEFVQYIENYIEFYKPDTIFTHFKDDLNIDHRITYQAVLTATRPMPKQSVKEIYSFEIPSSTEWAFPTSFSPDYFVDISTTLDAKVSAMKEYQGEIRRFPHPRSEYGIQYLAGYRGIQCGCYFAEAFKTVRVIR